MSTQVNEQYRASTIGKALMDALDEMIGSGLIEPQLAIATLKRFDISTAEVMASKVKTKMSAKSHLKVYKFLDDVWTFVLENPEFKFDSKDTITSTGKLKIVATGKRIGPTQKEGKEGKDKEKEKETKEKEIKEEA